MIRLYRMDCLIAIKLLAVLTFVHATNGQTVTVSGRSRVAADDDTSLTCTVNGGTANVIQWFDDSKSPPVNIYSGSTRFGADDKYLNFKVPVLSLSETQSVMTIENAEVEDDGEYRCVIPTDTEGEAIDLVIEVASTVTLTLTSIVIDNVDMYVATCDAVGGKPQENITWTINGATQINGTDGNTIVDTNPQATAPFSNTKSVFTFPATLENYVQTLVCQVSGHEVLTELNGQDSKDLNIHTSPSDAGTTVTVDYVTQGTSVTVSCIAQNQPSPAMRNYYIFSNDTPIHESMEEVNTVTVSAPEEGTPYTCMAGNYLGNTTLSAAVPYDPFRPTTPSPTTAQETAAPPPVGPSQGGGTGPDPIPIGLIIGCVVAVIVIIGLIIVVIVVGKKKRWFKSSGTKSSGSSKPAGSAVGSSNGSEREKTKPEAAPRGHGSIQHTNDNPNQDMYAMVDKKPSGGRGGDAPDRGSGPGQNEPQGMLYADLDLSHKAGHTDKHVPKNENDVVVYSSILV